MDYKLDTSAPSNNYIDALLEERNNQSMMSDEETISLIENNEDDDFYPSRELTCDYDEEEESDSEEEEVLEVTCVTPELMRRCVVNFDFFNELPFDIKWQLMDDLADVIATSSSPKQYYTDTAFKILLERLDVDEVPSTNWIGALLIMFYSRKRININHSYIEAIYERVSEWESISPFLVSLIQAIEESH